MSGSLSPAVARAWAPRSRSCAAVCSAADSASAIASSASETQKATGDSLTAGEATSTSAPSMSSSGSALRRASASGPSEVLAARLLQDLGVAPANGFDQRHELEDLRHRAAGVDLAAGQ